MLYRPQLIVVLLPPGFAAGCAAAHIATPRAGWKTYNEGSFSFNAPVELEPARVVGIDSQMGRYVAPGMIVQFELGPYGSAPTEGSKIKVSGAVGTLALGIAPVWPIRSPTTPH